VVFDKDDFKKSDFNEAIRKAEELGYIVAWSNESFELWFLLHFIYIDCAIKRSEYIKKLKEIIEKESKNKYTYEKNSEDNFNIIMQYGSLKEAVSRSNKLLDIHKHETSFANKNPATNVVEIVETLFKEVEI
jgi:hypothetical protein